MIATNRAVSQTMEQVFASGHAYVTPFYNRVESKKEVRALFDGGEDLSGTAIVLSAPFGTGKTFFMETISKDLGMAGRRGALRVPDLTSVSELKRVKGEVLFLDEADVKSTWESVERGLRVVGSHLADSGRTALLLGDYALRNAALLAHVPSVRFLERFEPLDGPFLQGVVQQRLDRYIGEGRRRVDDIIDPELYQVLAPAGLAPVNSFRATLAFLQQIAAELPSDGADCRITLEMARHRAGATMDEYQLSDLQEKFLNVFLDYVSAHHPRGSGLEDGLDRETMQGFGTEAGYSSWDELADEIIEPFCDDALLLSRGIPVSNGDGDFARYGEPFFPSLTLTLVADSDELR